MDFSPKQLFAVLFFKSSAWLSNHAVHKIGLKVQIIYCMSEIDTIGGYP
jgi:hypothetical protein